MKITKSESGLAPAVRLCEGESSMRIGETIRTARKEQKLTQEQIADYLGVSAPAVNKWEKGASYPDITLLPPLARLLKMDLNTLLSFEEEMSESEISILCNQIYEVVREKGFHEGYQTAMEKIKEFPGCSLLIFNLASFLKGALIMFPVEDEKKPGYEKEIQKLFERVAENDDVDGRIRDGALNMLVIDCLNNEEYEKAEQILGKIPDVGVDKGMTLITLYKRQGRYDEALQLAQQKLYKGAGEVQNYLITLMEIAKEQGNYEDARYYGNKCKEIIETMELWEYGKYMADYEEALREKDPDKTIELLKKMLKAMTTPWRPGKSRLYKYAVKNQNDSPQQSDAFPQMSKVLIEEIEKSEELAYIRDREGFKEILSMYK